MNLHVCAKFGPDRTTGDDVYTVGRIHTHTDRHTHTLLYRYRRWWWNYHKINSLEYTNLGIALTIPTYCRMDISNFQDISDLVYQTSVANNMLKYLFWRFEQRISYQKLVNSPDFPVYSWPGILMTKLQCFPGCVWTPTYRPASVAQISDLHKNVAHFLARIRFLGHTRIICDKHKHYSNLFHPIVKSYGMFVWTTSISSQRSRGNVPSINIEEILVTLLGLKC